MGRSACFRWKGNQHDALSMGDDGVSGVEHRGGDHARGKRAQKVVVMGPHDEAIEVGISKNEARAGGGRRRFEAGLRGERLVSDACVDAIRDRSCVVRRMRREVREKPFPAEFKRSITKPKHKECGAVRREDRIDP